LWDRFSIIDIACSESNGKKFPNLIDNEMAFEAKNQPIVVFPIFAIFLNTLLEEIRLGLQTEMEVLSTKLIPVTVPILD